MIKQEPLDGLKGLGRFALIPNKGKEGDEDMDFINILTIRMLEHGFWAQKMTNQSTSLKKPAWCLIWYLWRNWNPLFKKSNIVIPLDITSEAKKVCLLDLCLNNTRECWRTQSVWVHKKFQQLLEELTNVVTSVGDFIGCQHHCHRTIGSVDFRLLLQE